MNLKKPSLGQALVVPARDRAHRALLVQELDARERPERAERLGVRADGEFCGHRRDRGGDGRGAGARGRGGDGGAERGAARHVGDGRPGGIHLRVPLFPGGHRRKRYHRRPMSRAGQDAMGFEATSSARSSPGATAAGALARRLASAQAKAGHRASSGGEGRRRRQSAADSSPNAVMSEALARFAREAHVLRTLSQRPAHNPHLVRFHDHGRASVHVAATGTSWDLPFTVLELVEGETLEAAIARAHPDGLGLARALRILRHVALALEDVHGFFENIVCRDLKPIERSCSRARGGGRDGGGAETAKVTDFGIAKLLDAGVNRTTRLAGVTVGYAPPEQFEDGNRRVGRATDVFALAAIFYEMLTGQPAFPIRPGSHPLLVIVRLLNEAPPALARAGVVPRELQGRPGAVAAIDVELSRALSPEPDDRHPTAMALLEAIERALTGVPEPGPT